MFSQINESGGGFEQGGGAARRGRFPWHRDVPRSPPTQQKRRCCRGVPVVVLYANESSTYMPADATEISGKKNVFRKWKLNNFEASFSRNFIQILPPR
jgi:hypothetical protein